MPTAAQKESAISKVVGDYQQRIAELEAENARLREAMPKLQLPRADRCACKFDESDNTLSMCSHHRDIIAAASTLFDHYLNAYEQNDGQRLAGERDHLGKSFEELVPDWRKMRDDWPGLM